MRRSIPVALFFFITHISFGQIGGQHVYDFLNLTSSPRVAALGGKLISYSGPDLSLAYYNPAVLDSSMFDNISLNYVNYFAGINYGYVSYAHPVKKYAVAYGLQYINYGTFTKADASGIVSGTFTAADYALNIAVSMKIDSLLTLGADIRPVLSTYEKYISYGISTDFGIIYKNPAKLYQLALVVRNLGSQIKEYYNTYETLPFEIQLGYTQQLKYAPLSFSITAQHLETWDLSVIENLNNTSIGDTPASATKKRGLEKFSDQLMRHLIFGAEIMPFKNFYVRVGYNYQRRQELKIDTRAAMVGFSWGFGLSIKRFQINYSRATYHLAGSSDHLSISTNLKSFYKKKTQKSIE